MHLIVSQARNNLLLGRKRCLTCQNLNPSLPSPYWQSRDTKPHGRGTIVWSRHAIDCRCQLSPPACNCCIVLYLAGFSLTYLELSFVSTQPPPPPLTYLLMRYCAKLTWPHDRMYRLRVMVSMLLLHALLGPSHNSLSPSLDQASPSSSHYPSPPLTYYLLMRYCAKLTWPHVEAACNGVHSSLSVTLTSAPASTRTFIMASLLSMQHWKTKTDDCVSKGIKGNKNLYFFWSASQKECTSHR